MPINDGLMSSKTDDWATPINFFAAVNKVFKFTLDVCASDDNHKCNKYFTEATNGLVQKWTGVCWMNPPYGREIGAWIKKAHDSALEGATVVCLVPARTDTKWWQDYCKDAEHLFVRGRLKFNDGANPAPFPSALVVFRPALKHVVFNT
jgi:phage N-6-adenine-methyltransferase